MVDFDNSLSSPDKALKESLDRVLLSGYFNRSQSHQNGVCTKEDPEEEVEQEEEVELPAAAAVESSEAEEQFAHPGQFHYPS